jgi:putative membrane protein
MKMINMGAGLLAFGGLLMMSSSAAVAQSSMQGQMQKQDASFAQDAASGGMAEVKLGQLAQKNGASPTVKQFGQRMETDHSAANEKLKSVASKDGMTIPGSMSQEDQATYDRLSSMSGAEFDKAYAQDMVQDHQKDMPSSSRKLVAGRIRI